MTDDAQDAEFDVVPTWTVEVALDLGEDHLGQARGRRRPSRGPRSAS